MASADSNRVAIAYATETTYGISPTSTAYTEMRLTGESLSFSVANIQSAEIRDDRMVADLIQTGAETGGGINFELSYNGFDSFLLGALFSSGWSTRIKSTRSDLTFETTGHIRSEWTSFASFVTGQWIRISGFAAAGATAANNEYYFITGARTTGIDVTPPPTVAVPGTDGGTLTVQGRYARNGVTKTSFSLERYHADVTQYFTWTGMVINSMSLSAAASRVISGGFEFMGKEATRSATAVTSAAYTAASANDNMNTVTNVGRILEGATLATPDYDLYFQEITFSLRNNLRGKPAIGVLGNVEVGVGSFEVTGTMNVYFKDGDLYDKYIAGTESGISYRLEDSTDHAYIFTFPRVKFETDTINAGGQNQDIMENLTWRAIRHATYDCMMQIDRFDI